MSHSAQEAFQMSANHIRAQGQRMAQSHRNGQLASIPQKSALGYAKRKALKPSPKPQPASMMTAPSFKGACEGNSLRAFSGVGNKGASRQE
jgi:hypothetical protein